MIVPDNDLEQVHDKKVEAWELKEKVKIHILTFKQKVKIGRRKWYKYLNSQSSHPTAYFLQQDHAS